uniref:LETM1-like protein n=2 Tax=Manihot esculenta TaxID=3983 RepID=A0A2C9VET3_MANES
MFTAVKLQHHNFISSRSLNPCLSQNSIGPHVSCKRMGHLDYILSTWGNSQKRCLMRLAFLGNDYHRFDHRFSVYRNTNVTYCKSRRAGHLFRFATADDGVTVNGSPSASTSSNVEELRVKLNQSLQSEDYGDRLVQSLHDAARVFELAIKGQGLLSKLSWFSTGWLGVDRNAWVKTLSYQASVYSLLQAACEISTRGEGRDRDVNMFVKKSLLRQSAPLESLMREKLSLKHPEAYEWFWSEQVPSVVASFVNYFEGDPRFTSATAVLSKGMSLDSGSGSDVALLLLALSCIAAITKLGATKVSCPQFFSMISDITGKLMDMLVDLVPIRQAYHYIRDIGLHREFLVHFGPRAAACRVKNDCSSEEVIFWVNLIEKQLQQAIDRERIWSRLTTSESIEVLEKDLAIFGFFIALGRTSRSFLSANGFDVIDDPIEGFIRYLIGGSVLYYPQLSSISSYQLYVEVVCEELDWLPFYPGNFSNPKPVHGHGKKRQGPPNAEAIPHVLDVCSYWMQSFIKYSKWLENPSHVKAARFLSRGHNKLMECVEEMGIARKMTESNNNVADRTGSGIFSPIAKEMDSFDKALESVEESMIRLEKLLQELHVSSANSGKEQLKAACSDLEKIRKLKKEAEFLEASFRAKAASLQGDDESNSPSSVSEQQAYLKGKRRNIAKMRLDRTNSKSRGVWNFFVRFQTKKSDPDLTVTDGSGDEHIGQNTSNAGVTESESNDILRFELLRNELIELEKRVQRSTDQSENEEDSKETDDTANYHDDAGSAQLVQVQKKENVIAKSLDKLKETSTV